MNWIHIGSEDAKPGTDLTEIPEIGFVLVAVLRPQRSSVLVGAKGHKWHGCGCRRVNND
jgi:hypothetical protein